MALRLSFPRVLAGMGGILVLGGVSHLVGVGIAFAQRGIPPVPRLVFLLLVAVAHWSVGALDLAAAGWWRREERAGATAMLAGAFLILACWAAVQAPAFVDHPGVISSGPLTYLLAQAAALVTAANKRGQAAFVRPTPWVEPK